MRRNCLHHLVGVTGTAVISDPPVPSGTMPGPEEIPGADASPDQDGA